MTQTQTHFTPQNPPIGLLLAEPLRVGNPDIAGPLAVFPVFGPEPHQTYRAFAEAIADGFRIGELDSGASVNDLAVENPTGTAVLLYEGEEVLGAQQNRTFDTSVLVAAGAKVRVPVSCVEVGRWGGRRRRESLRPAPQSAYPRLRREKARQSRLRVAAGLDARADQGEVWREVAAKGSRIGVSSPTGAMHDMFERRRDRLAEIGSAIHLHDGQLGALVAIAGKTQVLDLVGRPDVFASLHHPLVQGYALDALEHETPEAPEAPEPETARGFTLLVTDCTPDHRARGAGIGEELRFAANGVTGSALVHDGELITLTAFPAGVDGIERGQPVSTTCVCRPSRRRRNRT
jgi:hypothetical protein